MTIPVKTFKSPIVDEYGGIFPSAFVAIRAFSKSSQETGYSESLDGNYKCELDLEAITYKANYWYSEQTKAEGKRSRPLRCDDDTGGFTDVFEVNLFHDESIAILAEEPTATTITDLIESDMKRRTR